ncbi:pol-like protein [Colletotrichum kahawae]|uniref:Pol-like protein n=1 Tax=Colletotrichum kahawae TaxID=34407 RepID=A0AAD9Y912_COLKA|nr:pol-like protein [Colletotrichum kahawae]
MKPHECDTMDSPEGSVNDAMTAEIDRRDQITQLLIALNGLMSTDRATLTPLASSVPTPSTADTTIQVTSDGIATIVAEPHKLTSTRRPRPTLPDPPKFDGIRRRFP